MSKDVYHLLHPRFLSAVGAKIPASCVEVVTNEKLSLSPHEMPIWHPYSSLEKKYFLGLFEDVTEITLCLAMNGHRRESVRIPFTRLGEQELIFGLGKRTVHVTLPIPEVRTFRRTDFLYDWYHSVVPVLKPLCNLSKFQEKTRAYLRGRWGDPVFAGELVGYLGSYGYFALNNFRVGFDYPNPDRFYIADLFYSAKVRGDQK